MFYAKTDRKKNLIFEKWEDFENWQKWPLGEGYSLSKMVSLGQKIESLETCEDGLYNHIIVVLCKKWVEKTGNLWEMRGFWKLGKMASWQRL